MTLSDGVTAIPSSITPDVAATTFASTYSSVTAGPVGLTVSATLAGDAGIFTLMVKSTLDYLETDNSCQPVIKIIDIIPPILGPFTFTILDVPTSQTMMPISLSGFSVNPDDGSGMTISIENAADGSAIDGTVFFYNAAT